MNGKQKKLPVGIENFEEICTEDFYYVDKTEFIKDLLEHWGKVNLFTRPRRFGKTLNMSMLKCFFEVGCDQSLFQQMKISEETELCKTYMGKFPVVFVSLKDIEGIDFKTARGKAVRVINEEARRHQFLLNSEKLSEIDKEIFRQLLAKQMDDDTLAYSLRELTELLNKHYGKKVIVLIDEYDVPLAKANERGYYDEMVDLVRSLFGTALKTNDNLYFAVLTGCLRVAKESIFTGVNNFKVLSVADAAYDEYFGFTDEEVKKMLQYYGLDDKYETMKEWYDGYRFGNEDVYCPWDVICYCDKLRFDPALQPQNYWLNTSGNEVVEHFVESMEERQAVGNTEENEAAITKMEMERLVNGETVYKEIHQELPYKELYTSSNNLWSALFMTGYLTQRGTTAGDMYELAIPNREIRAIFTEQIMKLFRKNVRKDGKLLQDFCEALMNGKAERVEQLFTAYMEKTISIRDTFVRKPIRENFYHGILLGILGFKEGWTVTSNKESGDGYSDIQILIDDEEEGILIEIKYTDYDLKGECEKALKQIQEKRYDTEFYKAGVKKILNYGIACSKKKCQVLLEKSEKWK